MAISLTASALERARKFVASNADAVGLRFGVERTGCSGWGYAVDVAQQANADDQVFEFQGLKILVDPRSLPLVDGTEIDFVKKGLNHQFVFRNPNAAGECGCGESFTTDSELASG
ncbi:HesB/IscA family protein [Pseudomarimonas arenosa]|uniref:Iron-sulfur cluster assembly accessory protein n=1 Tax=Pseudomarimonas arenosa TaxID=2774145 RepID=A0AAW3ZTU3_9GAMM|nr:iron-sulfur cluster assembly accessory protein [Pseudomarimonas arenosa]MBD8527541.1 iron-sulfur cluster assembly accessory protein [Pseudomarimonas arenosa]